MHPFTESQVSAVQALLSLQLILGKEHPDPAIQRSSVHTSPSKQLLALDTVMHCPVVELQKAE